jgi:protein translocase SecG subunit
MLYLKTLIIVVQLLSALGVIGLVLLQHGKGADMGAAFGSGASGSLFGAYNGGARSGVFCHHADAHLPRRVSCETFRRRAGRGCDCAGRGFGCLGAGRWLGCFAGIGCVRPGDRRAEINFRSNVLLCVEQSV